jgi:hypothetical protein
MSTTKRRVNYLSKMKIGEVSLVMNPASPGADVLFTKARDVSDEPRDDHGRWTRLKEGVKGLSEHAANLARTTIRQAKIGTGIVTSTRPRGAHPIRGGGVQFGFSHTLSDGTIYHSTVQVRPEHLEKLTPKGNATREAVGLKPTQHILQRALARTENLLRGAGHGEVGKFGEAPVHPEGGFRGLFRYQAQPKTEAQLTEEKHQAAVQAVKDELRRLNDIRAASGLRTATNIFEARNTSGLNSGSGGGGPPRSPDPANTITPTVGSGYGHSTNSVFGFPTYHAPDTPPPNLPAGGQSTVYRGVYIPAARGDVMEGMKRYIDWAAQHPERARQAQTTLRQEKPTNGNEFFTPEGDFVPRHTVQRQQGFMRQYAEHRGTAEKSSVSGPARLFLDEGGGQLKETDLGARTEQQMHNMFPPKEPTVTRGPTVTLEGAGSASQMVEHAGTGHRSGHTILKDLFPSSETAVHKIRRVPDGIARGIFHAEEREHKYQLSGFDKSTLSTRHTKSSGSPVDYAQKVAKSKFRRGDHG